MTSLMMRLECRVGERPFQAVPHLDPQRPIVLRHDEKRAVVHVLPPRLPLLRDAQGVLLDRFRRGGGNDEDGDLAAFPGFKRPQGLFQGGFLLLGERGGQVGDAAPPAGGTGTCAPAATRRGRARAAAEQDRASPSSPPTPAPALLGRLPYGFAGAGAKSTLGGLEISFSFSTVKFGFVL